MLVLDGTRPSGALEWVPRVAPVAAQAAVGAGHWAAGRRLRALAAWTSAAGFAPGAWGLGTDGMVLRVRFDLGNPRRLTVLAIAVEAPNAVIHVPWLARAVQQRRPRIAAGWALVVAASVARLRAASAEPLR